MALLMGTRNVANDVTPNDSTPIDNRVFLQTRFSISHTFRTTRIEQRAVTVNMYLN